MTRMILFATLALGLAACGKGDGETKTEPATSQPTAPVAADTPADPAAADPAAGGTDPAAADAGTGAEPAAGSETGGEAPPEAAAAEPVPTTEDFEEKAAKEVDQKNLETEVTKMEKELGMEPPKK
jgi:hypothetical protein